jgi:hypothetical protein
MAGPVIEGRLAYTNRDYDTVLAELETLVRQTRPELWSDFFESNLGLALIQLNALVADMLSYGQDALGAELFLSTCRRYESALRFCNSVGYVPRSASAAEVTVQAVNFPDAITTHGATVPAGSVITNEDGYSYELLEDAVIPAGSTFSSLSLREGQSWQDSFDPSVDPGQEVTTARGIVAEDSWEVYVGTVSPVNRWTEVSNVAFETTPTQTYETSFDGDGKLIIKFGDGSAGKIPDDTITVVYRTTNGSSGNSPVASIRGALTVNLTGGGTVSVTYENSNSAASGGEDRESLDELRVSVPAYIASQDKLITLQDYETNIPSVPGVALAFVDIQVASYASNVLNVNVFDSEETTFTSESPVDLVRSTVDYTRYAQMSQDRANDVQTYLRARTMESVHHTILRPTVAWVDIYLGNVVYDEEYDKEEVHAAVTAAVVAAFEAAGGFSIRVSEVYNAIRDVLGVSYFYIERIVFDHLDGTAATGTVEFTGDVNPADADWITISDGEQTVTFEFDNNSSVTPGNIPVVIGASASETLENLMDAINSYLLIRASEDRSATDPTLDLIHVRTGSQYNVPITKNVANPVTLTGMAGGDDTLVQHIEDHRRNQEPVPDLWPPGPYVPGEPFDPPSPWQDGGQLPYEEIEDPEIIKVVSARRYYDETYLYNNEIYYNAGVGGAAAVQAINLRRLVFELVTQ